MITHSLIACGGLAYLALFGFIVWERLATRKCLLQEFQRIAEEIPRPCLYVADGSALSIKLLKISPNEWRISDMSTVLPEINTCEVEQAPEGLR